MCFVGGESLTNALVKSGRTSPGAKSRRTALKIQTAQDIESAQYRKDNPLPPGYGPGKKFYIPIGRQLDP